MSHLSHDTVSAFLAGVLSPTESESVETHLDQCDDCRRLVSEVVRQRRGTHASLGSTDVVPVGTILPAAIGDVIDGRYRIVQLLGVGGMGCVFEAHQVHLNQRVALKFILPSMVTEASAVGRFMREARAAARLRTPHVCHVLDLGTLATGTPFLAMEFLEGETVEQRLGREGPFSVPLAVRVVFEVIDALAEAHGIGVIHRDLKPANLFFARAPTGVEVVKVLDFGIAKSVHPDIEHGLASTAASMVLGSPQYMAPEQLVPGTPADHRADIWSLGCVMYQLLTGVVPFNGQTLVDLMYAIQRHPFEPVRVRRPDVPPALEAVVHRCLAKSPSQRPQTVQALREALFAAVDAPAPGGPAALAATVLSAATVAASAPTQLSAPKRRASSPVGQALAPKRLPWVIAISLSLIMLGAAAVLIARELRGASVAAMVPPSPLAPVATTAKAEPTKPPPTLTPQALPSEAEPGPKTAASAVARVPDSDSTAKPTAPTLPSAGAPKPTSKAKKPLGKGIPAAPDELLDERR